MQDVSWGARTSLSLIESSKTFFAKVSSLLFQKRLSVSFPQSGDFVKPRERERETRETLSRVCLGKTCFEIPFVCFGLQAADAGREALASLLRLEREAHETFARQEREASETTRAACETLLTGERSALAATLRGEREAFECALQREREQHETALKSGREALEEWLGASETQQRASETARVAHALALQQVQTKEREQREQLERDCEQVQTEQREQREQLERDCASAYELLARGLSVLEEKRESLHRETRQELDRAADRLSRLEKAAHERAPKLRAERCAEQARTRDARADARAFEQRLGDADAVRRFISHKNIPAPCIRAHSARATHTAIDRPSSLKSFGEGVCVCVLWKGGFLVVVKWYKTHRL